MSFLKNINKIFLYLLVIINLCISFEYLTSQNSKTNDNNVELILTAQQLTNDSIHFDQFTHFFSSCEPKSFYKKTLKFKHQISNQNLLLQQRFCKQKHIALNFKADFLQITINEISIQKSHCI